MESQNRRFALLASLASQARKHYNADVRASQRALSLLRRTKFLVQGLPEMWIYRPCAVISKLQLSGA